MKPKLLVVELWGLGDLVIATPFLRAASERFSVTLLAKPYAKDLQERFWAGVTVVPFTAPWTAFKHKYRVLSWPWRQIFKLRRTLAAERFDYGLSARWDPRDHLLLQLVGARNAFGFPRIGSQLWLRQPLSRPDPAAHRYEYWRVMAEALGFTLPSREKLVLPRSGTGGEFWCIPGRARRSAFGRWIVMARSSPDSVKRGSRSRWPVILTNTNGGSRLASLA